MNPYRTYLMKAAALMALLLSLTFSNSQKASAQDCGFSFSSNDITWTFSAVPGTVQNRYLVITNTSSGRLVINLAVSGSEAFTIDKTTLALNAGDTGNVMITFHPGSTAHGTLSGVFTATKDGSDCHQSLKLSGEVKSNTTSEALVADPHEFNFGTVAVGSKVCKDVKITNTSSSLVLNFAAAGFSCGNTNFSVSGWGVSSIAPGASVTISICYAPIATGIQSNCNWSVKYSTVNGDGTLVIGFSGTSSGDHNTDSTHTAELVADPHEFSFGTVAAGTKVCKDIIITNKSGKTMTNISAWSKGCDDGDFTISGNIEHAIVPGTSKTITICYTPHEANLSSKCYFYLTYDAIDSSSHGKLTINFNGNSTAHHNDDSLCLHTEQGHNYADPVIIGGSAEHTLYLINKTSSDITITNAEITGTNANQFTIVSTLPIVVPAGTSNTTFTYSFNPTSNNSNTFYFKAGLALTVTGANCARAEGTLIGIVVHSAINTDTVVRPLFPTEKRTLGIESNGKITSKSFYFTNNLDVDATVNKVYMEDGTYFTITSTTPTPTPFVLHPGDNLVVVVAYTATDHLVHHDHLMIDADHQLQSTSFDMQGVLGAAAGVATVIPAGVTISVSPNPASSFVNVNMTGVQMADVQIIDLLGNTIATAKANTMWKWNASNIAAGSYIVRIAGESLSGENFVTSKRVVVSK